MGYNTGIASIFCALVIPLVAGPLSVFICFICKLCVRSDTMDITTEFTQNVKCISLLTIIFMVTYSVNMILAEILFNDVSIMVFILMKYSFGSLHTLFSPIAIIISYPYIRKSLVQINKWGSVYFIVEDFFFSHIWYFLSNFLSHIKRSILFLYQIIASCIEKWYSTNELSALHADFFLYAMLNEWILLRWKILYKYKSNFLCYLLLVNCYTVSCHSGFNLQHLESCLVLKQWISPSVSTLNLWILSMKCLPVCWRHWCRLPFQQSLEIYSYLQYSYNWYQY